MIDQLKFFSNLPSRSFGLNDQKYKRFYLKLAVPFCIKLIESLTRREMIDRLKFFSNLPLRSFCLNVQKQY